MRGRILACILGMVAMGCSRNGDWARGPILHITGDEQSVGAEIFVDGEKIGVMQRQVYAGPELSEEELKKQHEAQRRLGIQPSRSMKPGDVFAVAVDIRIAKGEKQPEYGVQSFPRVPLGKHEILFVGPKGQQLRKHFDMKGETYMRVDFQKMVIRGAD